MAKKKDDVPEHISKYKKLTKKAKRMVDTRKRHHRQSYDFAVDEVLTKDGQVDMDLLDDVKNQDKFIDKMSDHYTSRAQKALKIGGKLNELETELLRKTYVGVTKAELKQIARQLGKNFTFDQFYSKHVPKMMETIEDTLESATMGHFNEEHINDIIKYTKSSDFIDSKKLRLPEALGILQQYGEMGVIPEKAHKKAVYYKKKKK